MSKKKAKVEDGKETLKATLCRNYKTIDLKLMPENLIYSFGTEAQKNHMAALVSALHDACHYKMQDGTEVRFIVRDSKTQKYTVSIPLNKDKTPIFVLEKADEEYVNAYNEASAKLDEYVVPLFWQYVPTLMDLIRQIDPLKYWVLGIIHDKDYNCDDFWEPSIEKPHVHINGKCLCKSFKLRTWFNLFKLELRHGIDDVSFYNGYGLRSISEREDKEYGNNFSRAVNYLTHDTDQAIQDGKYHYDVADIFSNLTSEEVEAIRKGTRPATLSTSELKRMCAQLDDQAYDIGYGLRDFDAWWAEQPYEIRTRKTDMKTIAMTYDRGLTARVEAREEFSKLSLIISSAGNMGKTETVKRTLNTLGYADHEICYVTTTGSGKYDSVKTYHRALVVDDVTASSILSLCDSRICSLKARNYNRVFTGDIVVIVTNLDPQAYVRACLGNRDQDDTDTRMHIKPAISRLCSVVLTLKDGIPVFSDRHYMSRGVLHAFEVGARANAFLDTFKNELSTYKFQYRFSDNGTYEIERLLDKYGNDARKAMCAWVALCDYRCDRSLKDVFDTCENYMDYSVSRYEAFEASLSDIPECVWEDICDQPVFDEILEV